MCIHTHYMCIDTIPFCFTATSTCFPALLPFCQLLQLSLPIYTPLLCTFFPNTLTALRSFQPTEKTPKCVTVNSSRRKDAQAESAPHQAGQHQLWLQLKMRWEAGLWHSPAIEPLCLSLLLSANRAGRRKRRKKSIGRRECKWQKEGLNEGVKRKKDIPAPLGPLSALSSGAEPCSHCLTLDKTKRRFCADSFRAARACTLGGRSRLNVQLTALRSPMWYQ